MPNHHLPFLDLKRQYRQIKHEVLAAMEQVLEEAAFYGGKYPEAFEEKFARHCQTGFAVAVNSGTSALHLAMLTLDIGRGDEVIVPANSFIATAWAASYTGATPVFADCTADTWQLDASQIEANITPRTKAIVGVHLYGQPCDVDAIKAIADRHNLYFIEDSAQAHGAEYEGRRVGGLGEMACFSFYPGKNLGTYGAGGGITTNNEAYARRLRSLRNHGSTEKYYHDEIGFSSQMGGLEAAVLGVKLNYLEAWNARRREIAKYYLQNIQNPAIRMQHQPDFAESVHHLFVITTENRDGLMKYLNGNGVFPGIHYPVPCHLQKAYAHLNHKKGDFPNAEYLSDHCLSLPMYAELTDEEVTYVAGLINKF